LTKLTYYVKLIINTTSYRFVLH